MVAEIVLGAVLLAADAQEHASAERGLTIAVTALAIVLLGALSALVLLGREWKVMRDDRDLQRKGLDQAKAWETHQGRVIRELQAELGWGDSARKTRVLKGTGVSALQTRRWPTGTLPNRDGSEPSGEDLRERGRSTHAIMPLPPEPPPLPKPPPDWVGRPTIPIPLVDRDLVETRDLRKRRKQPSSDG